ncbi:hypothetical protein FF36_03514 [Frankia torreyi]|uniref:Uncharacterized protein n=1 Tax=Frankia torreyi TaxID=1856 RepID=A0A0D8BDJ8_9ACTN|nr:hypothetical protein FF36_03514 [Frankia torreyi]
MRGGPVREGTEGWALWAGEDGRRLAGATAIGSGQRRAAAGNGERRRATARVAAGGGGNDEGGPVYRSRLRRDGGANQRVRWVVRGELD